MVFLGGHDDFGPSGHQSGRESKLPHLLGESNIVPVMGLPSLALCVEINILAAKYAKAHDCKVILDMGNQTEPL